MDNVFNWLFGTAPEGYEYIRYVFTCLVSLLLFDMILDIFRFLRYLVMGRR